VVVRQKSNISPPAQKRKDRLDLLQLYKIILWTYQDYAPRYVGSFVVSCSGENCSVGKLCGRIKCVVKENDKTWFSFHYAETKTKWCGLLWSDTYMLWSFIEWQKYVTVCYGMLFDVFCHWMTHMCCAPSWDDIYPLMMIRHSVICLSVIDAYEKENNVQMLHEQFSYSVLARYSTLKRRSEICDANRSLLLCIQNEYGETW
jgi:hypothetical protein